MQPMKQTLRVIENHRFTERDFIAGEAALDFVNTLAGRDQSEPRDRLDGYERLLEWAAHANLLPGKRLRALAHLAQREPAAAAKALARAKMLRESLFAVVSALAAGRAPSAEALARFPRVLARRRDGAVLSLCGRAAGARNRRRG